MDLVSYTKSYGTQNFIPPRRDFFMVIRQLAEKGGTYNRKMNKEIGLRFEFTCGDGNQFNGFRRIIDLGLSHSFYYIKDNPQGIVHVAGTTNQKDEDFAKGLSEAIPGLSDIVITFFDLGQCGKSVRMWGIRPSALTDYRTPTWD
jgi:hypothetical protein